MFDIGFPELMLVSIVALLVIGPDRLPETIRAIMLWLGRIRKSFANIKMELEQEIGADEIRRQIHNESILNDLKESRQSIQKVIDETDNSLKALNQSVADASSLDQQKNADRPNQEPPDKTSANLEASPATSADTSPDTSPLKKAESASEANPEAKPEKNPTDSIRQDRQPNP